MTKAIVEINEAKALVSSDVDVYSAQAERCSSGVWRQL